MSTNNQRHRARRKEGIMSEWWEDLEVKPTRYDLGPVLELNGRKTTGALLERYPDDYRRYRIELCDRGAGWGIFNSSMCLNKAGGWVWFRPVGDITDEWIEQHRWQDPQEAIAFYKAWLREFMETELGSDSRE